MRLTLTADEWWSTGVGYCLDIERFADADGDGHGDLAGLGAHLDHLTRLGVTFLWLQPFYPSPEGDDGYDVSDYYGVDPDVGTLGEFVEVVRAARERGMRVLVDLVVNHTSDQHPWFRSARSSPDSPYRDWYVWRDAPDPADAEEANYFPDVEDSIWTYDEQAGQYYRHRFYGHQPDLNASHAAVREEVLRIMGFWLQLGVSGFRVDAVPSIVETAQRSGDADDDRRPDGAPTEHLEEDLEVLDVMRAFLSRRSSEAIMLGEVNLPYEEQLPFFGSVGTRMTMNFDFTLNQAMYLALARRDAGPLVAALGSRVELAASKSYGVFVRNHDELTLDQLSEGELAEVVARFGPSEDEQLFGRGLRLRLPSMLRNDDPDPAAVRARLEMVYSLVFSLPGTPVLYYGEELAHGEDLSIPGRLAVRTPLVWGCTPDGTGVDDQERDPGSVLHFFRTLVARYRDLPELARGDFRLLDVGGGSGDGSGDGAGGGAGGVLAHACTFDGRTTFALHNLTGQPVRVALSPEDVPAGSELLERFSAEVVTADAAGGLVVDLPGHGYRWYSQVTS